MSCLCFSLPKRLYHCCPQVKEFSVNFCSLTVLGCVLHKNYTFSFFDIVKPVANSTRTIACLLFNLHNHLKPPSGFWPCVLTAIVHPLDNGSESFSNILPRKKLFFLLISQFYSIKGE